MPAHGTRKRREGGDEGTREGGREGGRKEGDEGMRKGGRKVGGIEEKAELKRVKKKKFKIFILFVYMRI